MDAQKTACLLMVGLLGLAIVGCHHAFGNKCVGQTVWRLDDESQVTLTARSSKYPSWADSELTYSDLAFELRTRDETIHRQLLRRCEQHDFPEVAPPRLGNLEVRAASDDQLIWIVDSETERVIALHDRVGNATTVFAEPPPWPENRQAVTLQRLSSP